MWSLNHCPWAVRGSSYHVEHAEKEQMCVLTWSTLASPGQTRAMDDRRPSLWGLRRRLRSLKATFIFPLASLRIHIKLATSLSLESTHLVNQGSHKNCVVLYVVWQNLKMGLGPHALESSRTQLKSPCHHCLTRHLNCLCPSFFMCEVGIRTWPTS